MLLCSVLGNEGIKVNKTNFQGAYCQHRIQNHMQSIGVGELDISTPRIIYHSFSTLLSTGCIKVTLRYNPFLHSSVEISSE